MTGYIVVLWSVSSITRRKQIKQNPGISPETEPMTSTTSKTQQNRLHPPPIPQPSPKAQLHIASLLHYVPGIPSLFSRRLNFHRTKAIFVKSLSFQAPSHTKPTETLRLKHSTLSFVFRTVWIRNSFIGGLVLGFS